MNNRAMRVSSIRLESRKVGLVDIEQDKKMLIPSFLGELAVQSL